MSGLGKKEERRLSRVPIAAFGRGIRVPYFPNKEDVSRLAFQGAKIGIFQSGLGLSLLSATYPCFNVLGKVTIEVFF